MLKNFVCLCLILGFTGMMITACTPSDPQDQPPGTILRIISPDTQTIYITQTDLDSLPQLTIGVVGVDESGPSLLDVLALAGVSSFDEVTLTGNSSISLDAAQVTANVILSQTTRGKVKLVAESIPRRDWVTDIKLIEAK